MLRMNLFGLAPDNEVLFVIPGETSRDHQWSPIGSTAHGGMRVLVVRISNPAQPSSASDTLCDTEQVPELLPNSSPPLPAQE